MLSQRDALALFPELDEGDGAAAALREQLGVPLVVASATVEGGGRERARVRVAAGGSHETVRRGWLPAVDPIGSGDAFCAGFLHALLGGRPVREALEYGDAVSVLKLSIPGDAPVVARDEVDALLGGRTAGVDR